MSQRQSPQPQVTSCVGHSPQHKLNCVNHLVHHDLPKVKLLMLVMRCCRQALVGSLGVLIMRGHTSIMLCLKMEEEQKGLWALQRQARYAARLCCVSSLCKVVPALSIRGMYKVYCRQNCSICMRAWSLNDCWHAGCKAACTGLCKSPPLTMPSSTVSVCSMRVHYSLQERGTCAMRASCLFFRTYGLGISIHGTAANAASSRNTCSNHVIHRGTDIM